MLLKHQRKIDMANVEVTTKQVKQQFIEEFYNGDRKAYLKARRTDYCKVQLMWTYFVDSLCKDGLITQHHYDNMIF